MTGASHYGITGRLTRFLNVMYFASHIRALTESLDSAFADVVSQLLWVLLEGSLMPVILSKGSYRLRDASEAAANKAARLTQQLLCNVLCLLLLEFSVSFPNCK